MQQVVNVVKAAVLFAILERIKEVLLHCLGSAEWLSCGHALAPLGIGHEGGCGRVASTCRFQPAVILAPFLFRFVAHLQRIKHIDVRSAAVSIGAGWTAALLAPSSLTWFDTR